MGQDLACIYKNYAILVIFYKSVQNLLNLAIMHGTLEYKNVLGAPNFLPISEIGL